MKKKDWKNIGHFVLSFTAIWFAIGHYEQIFWSIIHVISCYILGWYAGKGVVWYWQKGEEGEKEEMVIGKLMFVIHAETGGKYTQEELRIKASNVYYADNVII